jgi:hypothetical protein
MLFGVSLLLASAGITAPNPDRLMTHDTKQNKMRHLGKNVQKAVLFRILPHVFSLLLESVCLCCPVPHLFPRAIIHAKIAEQQ